jgi:hypothetical protein
MRTPGLPLSTRHLILLVASGALLVLVTSCAARHPVQGSHSVAKAVDRYYAKQGEQAKVPNRILDLVKQLPKAAPEQEMEAKLESMLLEIGRGTRQDMPLIRESLLELHEQPNVVRALARRFDSLPSEKFQQRLLTLQVLGELQRPDALEFLRSVVWKPLPTPAQHRSETLTPRDLERVIQAKAIQCVAFVRDAEGGQYEPAVQETLHVIQEHPVRSVRIAAIDAYMWNHQDTQEAADALQKVLPPDFHKYLDMPRFHRGVNRDVFNARLRAWRNKWAQPAEKR